MRSLSYRMKHARCGRDVVDRGPWAVGRTITVMRFSLHVVPKRLAAISASIGQYCKFNQPRVMETYPKSCTAEYILANDKNTPIH